MNIDFEPGAAATTLVFALELHETTTNAKSFSRVPPAAVKENKERNTCNTLPTKSWTSPKHPYRKSPRGNFQSCVEEIRVAFDLIDWYLFIVSYYCLWFVVLIVFIVTERRFML